MTHARPVETERKCFVCHQTKPIQDFSDNGRNGGKRLACEDCYMDGRVNDHHRKAMHRQAKTEWMRRERKYFKEQQYQ